jgi:hypothetical protein
MKNTKPDHVLYNLKDIAGPSVTFFENLPELLRPEFVASALGISKFTIYDWRYRQDQRGAPKDLFVKFNRHLYLRTSVLKRWIASQNASFI